MRELSDAVLCSSFFSAAGDGSAPTGGIAVRMDVDPLTGEYLAGARVVGTGARHAGGSSIEGRGCS